jgi:hypothetical protein
MNTTIARWMPMSSTPLDPVMLLPFSAPADIANTRLLLQRLVSYVGYPYLVVRLGVAPGDDTMVRTPRLPAEQTLQIRP